MAGNPFAPRPLSGCSGRLEAQAPRQAVERQFDIIAPDSATGRRMPGRFAQHVAPKAVIRRIYRTKKLTDNAASVLLSMVVRMLAITEKLGVAPFILR